MANYRKIARRDARRYGLDPNVFGRQIKAESGYNPHAVSPAGARGIAQFMPGTARGLGVNPDNPVQALDAAAKLMANYVKKFGSYKNALVAYNAGPGRVGRSLPAETQNYVAKILGGSDPKRLGAPKRTTAGTATNASYGAPADAKTQIALSLLGMGNLSGDYGGSDPLTEALLSAAQAQKGANRGHPRTTGVTSAANGRQVPYGNVFTGSPIAGEKAAKADHPTAGLPGYPAHDYMAPAGTPVVAPVSGKIIKLSGHDPKQGPTQGPHGPFGWSVYVQGDDGKTYFLTHLGTRKVKLGQRVRQGAVIGSVGNYAKYGGANHVHEGVHG